MPSAYGLGTSKKEKPYADYDPCPRPMAWARVIRVPDKEDKGKSDIREPDFYICQIQTC